MNLIYGQNKLLVVKDKNTLKPISFASLIINNRLFQTDENGEFVYAPKCEVDTIIVKYIGYARQLIYSKNTEKLVVIFLEEQKNQLKEILIESYKEEKLATIVIQAYNKALLQNKSSQIFLKSYTLTKDSTPVEYIKSYYNITFEKGKISDLKLKFGQIIFPYEKLEDNFLSYGNSQIIRKSNPFNYSKDTQFVGPFYYSNSKKLLSKFRLSYKRIDDSLILINCLNKISNYQTNVLINKWNLSIEEILSLWNYTDYYPIISLNNRKLITDTMKIVSKLYFQNNCFQWQNLSLNFKYGDEIINSYSTLQVMNEPVFHEPNNDIDFHNDYFNIISKPKYPESITKLLFTFSDTLGATNKLFYNEFIDKNLVNSSKFDERLFEDFTKTCIPKGDFYLNWNRINEKSNPSNTANSTLKTYIFSDFICHQDSIVYNIVPYIDYGQSNFNYEKTPTAEHYLNNFYYLTKIYADSLYKTLQAKFISCPSNDEFDKISSFFDNQLEKTLWKYKFETNAGENKEAMMKWDEYILSKLVF